MSTLKTEIKYVSLRVTPDMHNALEKIARMEHRSMHGQIISVLEEFLSTVELEEEEPEPARPKSKDEIREELRRSADRRVMA